MSSQDQVSNVMATAQQFMLWTASDWLLFNLLHGIPNTRAASFFLFSFDYVIWYYILG